MVLLKENHLPSNKWSLGRIVQVHPGHDNIVRVVTVKTSTGEIKRSVTKLCPLPANYLKKYKCIIEGTIPQRVGYVYDISMFSTLTFSMLALVCSVRLATELFSCSR